MGKQTSLALLVKCPRIVYTVLSGLICNWMPATVRTQPVAHSTYSRGCMRAIQVPTL
jgi:hypothetical protein